MENSSKSFIPYGCTEWTLPTNIDYDVIDPTLLEKAISVRVGRDYHGSSIYNTTTIFGAITDIDYIANVVDICGVDYLFDYIEPVYNGNILHACVANPNEEIPLFMLCILPTEAIQALANQQDRRGCVPLELVTFDVQLFRELMKYTIIDESMKQRLIRTTYAGKVCLTGGNI